MKAIVLCLIILVVLVVVLSLNKTSSTAHPSNKVESFQVTDHPVALAQANVYAFMTPYIPQISDVHITNKKDVFKKSAFQSGMLSPSQLAELNPHSSMRGEQGFDHEVAIVDDSLEMTPTLQQQRYQLSAALASYQPQDGLPPNKLWYSKKNLDGLEQPGLHPQIINYSSQGFV